MPKVTVHLKSGKVREFPEAAVLRDSDSRKNRVRYEGAFAIITSERNSRETAIPAADIENVEIEKG
jgi:hypothetical protein